MKTKFILHGGFTSAPNELNKSFYKESTKGLSDGATILLVYFARKEGEVHELFEEDKGRILKYTDTKKLHIVLADEENFMSQVQSAHAIYMRGGDTDKLLNALKKYADFSKMLEGKIVSGSSAGAYVLSVYYHSAVNGEIHKGLGILPIRVICHYQSTILKSPDDPIALMEEYPKELELVVLKDYEWKSF